MFIDTHTHLYSSQFKEDRTEIVQKAINSGITMMVLPSIDSSYYDSMIELEQQFPNNIRLMMGLHPCDVKPENYQAELAFVKEKLSQRSFAAVGEIGIDLYWDKSTLKIQQEAFNQQIEWAKEHNMSINIHCREAFEEVLEILEAQKDAQLKGIFHCFSGDITHARRAIDCGMLLGIGGVVTFKNGKIDQFLHEIDLQHIVLETDAPYLAPVPYRGKRNESSYISIIADKLATIYQKNIKEIATITTENARRILNLD